MAKIAQDLLALVGNTPLMRLERYGRACGLEAELVAKLEAFNPAGSAKDRVALAMIEAAEKQGKIKPGATLIEPTSGNTGIGLALAATVKGYKLILTMPDTMSAERRSLLKAYGAELVLTDGALGMQGAVEKAGEIAARTPGSFIPGQFENPANPAAHRATTGPEIWRDTEGALDAFVAGVGTGGTLSGVGEYLKAQSKAIAIVAVEPAASPLLEGGKAGPHGLQGIGANFIPQTLDRQVYDEVLGIRDEEAVEACRLLAQTEGVLAGISSGAALWGATLLARRPAYRGKRIVVLLPDSGERYLSGGLFER